MDWNPSLDGGYPPSLPGASVPGSVTGRAPAAALRDVAQGFEAIMLRQLLAAADKVDFGGEELFGSSATDTYTDMRNARFAEIAAGQGTLGLAAQIEAQLARFAGEGSDGL